jgi:MerR family transcriptional regulator, light-induced transcriptional regulator
MGQPPENETHEARIGALGRAYADALLSGDEPGAEVAIREAMDAGLRTAQIDDVIIAPALWMVGELWERGEISVADEHLATEISLRVLALQREAQRTSDARGTRKILLATPAGELHVVALRMVANLLADAGYAVVMLGPDVPTDALVAAAGRHRPDVICLSSTMPRGAAQVLIALDAMAHLSSVSGFVLGGSALTAQMRGRPGIDVCRRVSEVVEAVDAIVKRSALN